MYSLIATRGHGRTARTVRIIDAILKVAPISDEPKVPITASLSSPTESHFRDTSRTFSQITLNLPLTTSSTSASFSTSTSSSSSSLCSTVLTSSSPLVHPTFSTIKPSINHSQFSLPPPSTPCSLLAVSQIPKVVALPHYVLHRQYATSSPPADPFLSALRAQPYTSNISANNIDSKHTHANMPLETRAMRRNPRGRSARELDVFRVSENGEYIQTTFNLASLKELHTRDLIAIDDSEIRRSGPVILPRRECIIVSVSHIKAIIFYDHVLVLDAHRPMVRIFVEFLRLHLKANFPQPTRLRWGPVPSPSSSSSHPASSDASTPSSSLSSPPSSVAPPNSTHSGSDLASSSPSSSTSSVSSLPTSSTPSSIPSSLSPPLTSPPSALNMSNPPDTQSQTAISTELASKLGGDVHGPTTSVPPTSSLSTPSSLTSSPPHIDFTEMYAPSTYPPLTPSVLAPSSIPAINTSTRGLPSGPPYASSSSPSNQSNFPSSSPPPYGFGSSSPYTSRSFADALARDSQHYSHDDLAFESDFEGGEFYTQPFPETDLLDPFDDPFLRARSYQDAAALADWESQTLGTSAFEFRVLEGILRAVADKYDRRLRCYTPVITTLLDDLTTGAGEQSGAIPRLLPLKNALYSFERVSTELLSVLEGLLRSNEDMLELFLTEKRKRHGQLPPLEAHQDCELFLEQYHREISQFKLEAQHLRKKILATEDLVRITMDSYRNRMIMVQAHMSLLSAGFAAGTVITGTFGMNLHSGLEHHPSAFGVVAGMSVVTVCSIYAFVYRRFLFRPLVKLFAASRQSGTLAEMARLRSHMEDLGDVQDVVLQLTYGKAFITREEFTRFLREASGKNISPAFVNTVFKLYGVKTAGGDVLLAQEELQQFLCDFPSQRWTGRSEMG